MGKNQDFKMTNSNFDDELDIPKGSPLAQILAEELAQHSVESLKNRLEALKLEIIRTEKAIADKGDARLSAESFFK